MLAAAVALYALAMILLLGGHSRVLGIPGLGLLAEALGGSKKIVVCTIQTFPFALKAVQELAATQGKRFAVIADEAH
ncbi:UNVERIFIED_CONTAM: hypothetical protein IGO34_31995, partial [Salmonella enterica subsp. enterica serovar Weltevreden]